MGSCFTALRQGKPWSYLRSAGCHRQPGGPGDVDRRVDVPVQPGPARCTARCAAAWAVCTGGHLSAGQRPRRPGRPRNVGWRANDPHHRGGRPGRGHAAPAAGPPGPDPAPAGHRRPDRRARGGGGPRLGHRHGRDDRRLPRCLGRDPSGEHLRRGLLGGHPPGQHPGHLRGLRGGAAGGRAPGHLRVVQPCGRVHAAGELPRARLRLPGAGHLLRRGQGGGRGAGRALPLQVRPGHDLHSHPDLLRKAAQRPGAVHLAVPGRRRAAVRGLPDRAGSRASG